MTENESIQEYFTDRRRKCLSVKQLETEAGIPAKTLDHALTGRRNIPEHHLEKLIPVLADFGYIPQSSHDQFL